MGLDAVELIVAYEEAFGIEITDVAAARMRTPRDVIDHVLERGTSRTREEIALVVRRVTLEQLGDVDYGEDTRFIEDMGMS